MATKATFIEKISNPSKVSLLDRGRPCDLEARKAHPVLKNLDRVLVARIDGEAHIVDGDGLVTLLCEHDAVIWSALVGSRERRERERERERERDLLSRVSLVVPDRWQPIVVVQHHVKCNELPELAEDAKTLARQVSTARLPHCLDHWGEAKRLESPWIAHGPELVSKLITGNVCVRGGLGMGVGGGGGGG